MRVQTYGTYNVGVRSPGYNLWPLKFVTQLFKQTLTITPLLDLRLHTRTPVTAVSPSSSSSTSTSTSNSSSSPPLKWTLTTPRGALACSSVLHATNGYASHLLPFMAGSGPQGIVPVRGQVLAMRANAPLRKVTTASWSGNEGYWFPRPVAPGADDDDDDEEAQDNPLVILGGARDSAGLPFEMDVTDDAQVDKTVGAVLRAFLPDMFPGLYEQGREPEAEWVRTEGTEYVFSSALTVFVFLSWRRRGLWGIRSLIFRLCVPSLALPCDI